MTKEQLAEKLTEYLVHTLYRSRKKRHFMVLAEDGEIVPFEWQWKRKNSRGITFEAGDVAGAEAWVKCALLADYRVFRSWNKGSGLASGRGLQDGLPAAR